MPKMIIYNLMTHNNEKESLSKKYCLCFSVANLFLQRYNITLGDS